MYKYIKSTVLASDDYEEYDDFDDYDDPEYDDEMGDVVDNLFSQACDNLDIWDEPSIQGGEGSDFFYNSDDEEVGVLDWPELVIDMKSIYRDNKDQPEDVIVNEMMDYLKRHLDL